MELLGRHKLQPDLWTYEKVAAEYKLDPQVAFYLLTYYSDFNIAVQDMQDPWEDHLNIDIDKVK